MFLFFFFFFFQAEDGIRDADVTGVQTCALPISGGSFSGSRTPCVYCHLVPSGVKMFWRINSRFSGVGEAQYFRIGPQASPSPSSYAFPFCEMMAVTRSG